MDKPVNDRLDAMPVLACLLQRRELGPNFDEYLCLLIR